MKRLVVLGVVCALLCTFMGGCNEGSFVYENAKQYTAGAGEIADNVENLEIGWLRGKVKVKYHASDKVVFSEASDSGITDKTAMRHWLEGSTLHLQFCESGKDLPKIEKTLTLWLPENKMLGEVDIGTVSADVNAEGLKAANIEIETVSGDVALNGVSTSGELELDNVSGSINVTADSLGKFEINSTSGNVSLSAAQAPAEGEVNSVSGDVKLFLPADANFTVDLDSVSGSFSCDIPAKQDDRKYIFGSGNSLYRIKTTSGDVIIKAYK